MPAGRDKKLTIYLTHMSKRTKRIIGAIVVVIILLLLLLLLWLLSQRPDAGSINVGNQPTNTNQPLGSLNTSSGGGTQPIGGGDTEPNEPEPEPEPADLRASLRSLAAAFAERYGSYSNQGDFENLEELQALMTDSLTARTDAFIADARAENSGMAAYAGVTTRAINAQIKEYDEAQGTATVTVKTQREEITAQESRVYYQDLVLDFVLDGEIWKVSAAEWVEEDG